MTYASTFTHYKPMDNYNVKMSYLFTPPMNFTSSASTKESPTLPLEVRGSNNPFIIFLKADFVLFISIMYKRFRQQTFSTAIVFEYNEARMTKFCIG